MTEPHAPWWWPPHEIEAAVVGLARRAGLVGGAVDVPPCVGARIDVGRRFDRVAERLHLGSSLEELTFAGLADTMSRREPSLLHVPGHGLLAVLGRRGRSVELLLRDGRIGSLSIHALRAHLASRIRPAAAREVESLLTASGVAPRRRRRASARMLAQRIGAQPIGLRWGLRLHGGAPLPRRLHRAGVARRFALLLLAYFVQHGVFVLSWGLIGLGALEGRIEPGWLVAWALLLLTQVPLRIVVAGLRGSMTIRAGAVLKQRFMAGALRLRRAEIGAEGVGRLLGRVLESDALEHAALNAGFIAITAVVELSIALGVVVAGAGAWPNGLLLGGWTAVAVGLGLRHAGLVRRWTDARLALTDVTVERMLGHETRVFQQSHAHWHDGEDGPLADYLSASRALDRARARYQSVIPRGWLVLGISGAMLAGLGSTPDLTPDLTPGSTPGSTAPLALALGGVLLARGALAHVVDAFISAAPAIAAWRQVRVIFEAGARREGVAPADFAPGSLTEEPGEPMLTAKALTFSHRAEAPAVLRGCSLTVAERDRVVLRGPSGSGKSTLAAALTGLVTPQAGTVLFRGVDRLTTGDRAWRWTVLGVCQFHDNHVFNTSLAFNLLMGRRWPPRDQDWEDAKDVCRALGLGALLDRMPAGLMQVVGQTGWPLSHGERSRLFVARALLQDPDVLVLDESFGALDPETARACLAEIDRRARALIVIAHP